MRSGPVRPARRRHAALLGAILSTGLVPVLAPGGAFAWGGRTHEIINRRAVDFLPEPARTAWTPLAPALGAHASDADHRKGSDADEPPRHYLDADAYDEPPFDGIPRDLDVLKRRHGAQAVAKWGVAPWAIDECWRMVVRSLEVGDWGSAGAWAADLGHYVADTHQPLHCTVNYDGQATGNRGIHLRWEVTLMDRAYDESTIGPPDPPAEAIGDPLEACFAWMAEAHAGVAVLLAADDAATAADPSRGDRYWDVLWSGTQPLAETQVRRAARDVAGLWRAAWEAAGSPPGPEVAPPFRALPVEALEPPPGGDRRAGRGALALAGGVVVGALILAAR